MPNFLRTMPISASAASAHLLTSLKREGSGLKESLADCIFCSFSKTPLDTIDVTDPMFTPPANGEMIGFCAW